MNQDLFPKRLILASPWDKHSANRELGDDTRSPPVSQCAPRMQVFSGTANPVWLRRHRLNLINARVLRDSLQKFVKIVCSLAVDRRKGPPRPRELASTLTLRFPYNWWDMRGLEEWVPNSLALPLAYWCQLGPPSAEHRLERQPPALSSSGSR